MKFIGVQGNEIESMRREPDLKNAERLTLTEGAFFYPSRQQTENLFPPYPLEMDAKGSGENLRVVLPSLE